MDIDLNETPTVEIALSAPGAPAPVAADGIPASPRLTVQLEPGVGKFCIMVCLESCYLCLPDPS